MKRFVVRSDVNRQGGAVAAVALSVWTSSGHENLFYENSSVIEF